MGGEVQVDAFPGREFVAILDALKITGYSKVSAADLLGIHRTLLYKKIQKYAIPLSPEDRQSAA